MSGMARKAAIRTALRYGVLSVLAFVVVCPLAWLAIASLSPQAAIFHPV